MSAEIASFEKVKGTVAHIRAHGGVATADRVIVHLGGGSKATVLRHLKTLRDGDVPEEAISPALFDLVRPALAEIFTAGAKLEADRSAAGLIRLTTAISELEIQVEELAAENASLQDREEVIRSERDRVTVEVNELRTSLVQSARELLTTRNELALERGASAEKLGSLMARLEASVTSIRQTARARQGHRNASG